MVPMVGPLALNNEPLASIYTGAPEPASGTVNQTPYLGGNSIGLVKNERSDVRTDGKADVE